MHLVELIFPSTSVIVPTPSLQIHPKTLDTRAPPLRLPYTVLNITCTTFLLLFTIHTLANFSLANTTFSSENMILFHFSCIVQCSLFRHNRTRFFLFSTKSSVVFSQQFSGESHTLLNRLWIDLLQIGTGTDWLNSFIKSCTLLLQPCFTSLFNVR